MAIDLKPYFEKESAGPENKPANLTLKNGLLSFDYGYAYDQINELIRNYEFDSQLNKSNNIENTINKLPDVFSKDDIRNVHPYISDSTINRTLKRLRDDEKIRPLGKGRSAKWIKLYKSTNKKIAFEQLDLKLR